MTGILLHEMSLIERYIMTETRRIIMAIIGFLIIIFASYSIQRYLTDAANGTLALQSVFFIVFYKILIALEMLLPVGVYVAVAVSLGQLHSDAEIVAIYASGSSPLRIYKAILFLAIPLGVIVTLISMYARPWAYAHIFQLKQQSQSELDISHLQEKKFNNNDNGRMILTNTIDRRTNRLSDVFIYNASVGHTYVFRAHSLTVVDPSPNSPAVLLHAGTAYQLDRHGSDDNGQVYSRFTLQPRPTIISADLRSKSAGIAELVRSSDAADKAELQWRVSRGISAVLMILLAVPLSRIKPRQGRFSTLLPLTVLFICIFYAGNICRSLVANGSISIFPGLWTIPFIMLAGFLALLARELSLFKMSLR